MAQTLGLLSASSSTKSVVIVRFCVKPDGSADTVAHYANGSHGQPWAGGATCAADGGRKYLRDAVPADLPKDIRCTCRNCSGEIALLFVLGC